MKFIRRQFKMNTLETINMILEEKMQEETNGVLNEKWSKIWDLVSKLDDKLNLFERIKYCGPLDLTITEHINMGPADSSDLPETLPGNHWTIDYKGDIWLNKSQLVVGRIASNGWLEITFADGFGCDIAFDEESDYDKYFKMY
jgi:hypothetical protein